MQHLSMINVLVSVDDKCPHLVGKTEREIKDG